MQPKSSVSHVSKGEAAGICTEQWVKKLIGFSRDQENGARSFEISSEDKKRKMSEYERILQAWNEPVQIGFHTETVKKRV